MRSKRDNRTRCQWRGVSGKTGQDEKKGGSKPRDLPRGLNFNQYIILNAPRARIMEEPLSANLLPLIKRKPTPKNVDWRKLCQYHQNMRHTTKECTTLRDKIEELIWARHLRRYVKDERRERSSPRKIRSDHQPR